MALNIPHSQERFSDQCKQMLEKPLSSYSASIELRIATCDSNIDIDYWYLLICLNQSVLSY